MRGVTIHMPYTARFYRDGAIEVECDWIDGSPLKRWAVPPSDSPWFRLPRSHLHIFTIGDTRAGVWIINSGVYIDDRPLQEYPGAEPQDKGGSVGLKWLVQPLPHRLAPAGRGWRIEQGVLSSFARVSQSANIPLQLDFDSLPPEQPFVEIAKGTPTLQYVAAALPEVELERDSALDPGLVDYLVSLSLIHDGGDYRELGERDEGAQSVMKSHALEHRGDRRYQRPKTEL